MKAKKIPYYILLSSLTLGASLTLGFLSFTGAMAIWPVMSVGVAFFVLSVAYEGEIYLQNIKGAFQKLFKRDSIKRALAKEFLLEHLPEEVNENDPQFLQNYANLKQELEGNTSPSTLAQRKKRKAIRKSLKEADLFFTEVLFSFNPESKAMNDDFIRSLQNWMERYGAERYQSRFAQRKTYYRIALIFSMVSGGLMGLGTVYLLASALMAAGLFTAVSFSLLSVMIGSGSLLSGIAYGFLTYNSLTDMINNNTLAKWYGIIKNDLNEHFGFRSILMALTAVGLIALGLVITVCTAGTWWTIIKETPSVFNWMKRVPSVVTAVLMPAFMGGSSLVFNLENSAETMEQVDDFARNPNSKFRVWLNDIHRTLKYIWDNETLLQMVNPFRLLLKITYTPLRIVLFTGHLLSIAATSDRGPGMSKWFSGMLGFFQEGVTDVNYFFEAGEDIPSVVLRWMFSPLIACTAVWHFGFSTQPYSKAQFAKHWNQYFTHNPSSMDESVVCEQNSPLSSEFKVHMALNRLQRWREKHQETPRSQAAQNLDDLELQLSWASSSKSLHEILQPYQDPKKLDQRLFAKLQRFDDSEDSISSINYQPG